MQPSPEAGEGAPKAGWGPAPQASRRLMEPM